MSESSVELQQSSSTMNWFKLQQWNVVFFLPFFYGAITRLPFIYFVIHMRFVLEMTWVRVGLFVGAYQAGRVVTSSFSILCPRISNACGCLLGLAGNLLVLLEGKSNPTSFLAGTAMIGFSETFSSMQIYAKKLFSSDLKRLEYNMKVQYASVMIGVTFAFGLGGYVYQVYAIDGIAIFGTALSVLELVGFVIYLVVESIRSRSDGNQEAPTKIIAEETQKSVSSNVVMIHDEEYGENAFETAEEASDDDDPVRNILNSHSESGIKANYINWLLCLTFGAESITIGYNLAISPVFILEEFGKDTAVIGAMLSAGAATGTLVSILVALTPWGERFMKKYIPSPYNIYFSLAGIPLGVFLASVPYFPVHVVGILVLMGFNDLAALMLNSMQGGMASERAYLTLGPSGQAIRRCLNVVTAISGPILFDIWPRLPYVVAGSITLLWVILLVFVMQRRLAATREMVNEVVQNKKFSFLSTEILARNLKKQMQRMSIRSSIRSEKIDEET